MTAPLFRTLGPCLLAVALTACGAHEQGSSSSVFNHISINDGKVTVHARQAPPAVILSDGRMNIDGADIVATAAQQLLLARYYQQAVAMRDDGVAVGAAGGAMAGRAIGAVVTGLASGNPEQIGPKVEAQAEKIETAVAELCRSLQALQSTQNAIAAELPAFQPYATITRDEVEQCHPVSHVAR